MAHQRRPVSVYGLAAAVVSSLTVVGYLALIAAQGEDDWTVVWLIAASILVGTAAAALASTVFRGRPRRLLLTLAAADHLVLGFLAIFSIGLPLLVASGLSVAGALRTPPFQVGLAPSERHPR